MKKETNEEVIYAEPLSQSASATVTANSHIPSVSASAVLGESASMPEGTPQCKGYDFNETLKKGGNNDTLGSVVAAMLTTGFQATNVGMAVREIERMRAWRLSDRPFREGVDDPDVRPEAVREKIRARVFLAYTSNQISSGQREVIRFLVQHKMVDVVVTTGGGVEEDIIKCMEPTFLGDFKLNGRELRKKGVNRIGNLLIPNNNYCKFEDWIAPIINKMHDEQDDRFKKVISAENQSNDLEDEERKNLWKVHITPSEFIKRLGLEIDHPDSVLYWAAKNDIPVFCPALTDGSIGDMLYFHSYKRPGFVLDISRDIRLVNDLAIRSHATGMIILGGGLVKHHTCNANLMRNGADFSVFINTAHEFDGSDAGASPDEAISWGKIRITAEPVKVCADATVVFPLIVSQTFAKNVEEWRRSVEGCVCWLEDANEA